LRPFIAPCDGYALIGFDEALRLSVINYGLKPVAWFSFALPLPMHAAGFSQ
jgi:hypothetical protein